MLKSPLIALAALVTIAAAPARGGGTAGAVVFSAPAAHSPAGPTSLGDIFGRILPSGRIVHPAGTSVVVGIRAQALTLTPSGRFAIVCNDDPLQAAATSLLDPQTTGGYTLAVVDTTTMTVVSRYSDASESFSSGVVAVPDPLDAGNTLVFASGGNGNVVYVFDLDATGTIKRDAQHTIAIAASSDARFASVNRAFPSALVANTLGTRVYAIDRLGNDVAQIDTSTRGIAGMPVPVGFSPFGAAVADAGLLVANEGLLSYMFAPAPTPAPPFETVPSDLARASSLSIVPQNPDGSLGPSVAAYAPLDRTPDGVRDIGGAQPAAVVAMRRRPYAFVAMSNVDRIATINLAAAAPVVAGGTELRLYNRGPYGTQPVALALAPSERRLYVALAGIDAIAVLDTADPRHLHRVGLIPTGWYPSALALSRDGRFLFVANAKGIGTDRGFTGDQASAFDARGRVTAVREDGSALWSTLERIDLSTVDLRKSTPLALSYLRTIAPAKPNRLIPQRFETGGSTAVKHVVFILQDGKSYDAMLGDLTDASGNPYGAGDPTFAAFDASVAPNLHALARTYALAGNFFGDADEPGTGSQFAAGGIATSFTQRTSLARNSAEDPEDYPRAGYIFDTLALRGKTYRDYGDLLRVSGYDDGTASDPKTDDPAYVSPADQLAPTQSLGGLYALTVPAPLALSGHVDLTYPGWNVRIRDTRRAQEFVRDFDTYVKSDTMPAFTYIWLPATRPAGAAAGTTPPLEESVSDADRALGTIIDYLTHIPQWSSTAIFITPSDALGSRDHVAPSRTYAIVVSPFAKHHYLGMRHLSTASVLKTEEEILGLPALSLGDALASDLSDFFTLKPDPTPYDRIAGP
jgi:DNA-binding beta-propeller fold protein YncE